MFGRKLSIFAICSMGRSGSTLLRNELAKSPGISVLHSGTAVKWLNTNHAALASSFPMRLANFRRQWIEEEYWKGDIRQRYARKAPRTTKLRRILLLKWTPFAFQKFDPPILHNLHLIVLTRDPVATALSHCRRLPGQDKPFLLGGGAQGLEWLAETLRPFAPELPGTDDLVAFPTHVAAAHLVRAYYRGLERFVATDPGRSLTIVRFEDFLANRMETLTNLFRTMGVRTPSPFPSNQEFYVDAEEEGAIRMSENSSEARSVRFTNAPEREEIAAIIGGAGRPFGY